MTEFKFYEGYKPLKTEHNEVDLDTLAQMFLDKADEDWTFIDPEDIKRLAKAVLERARH